MGKSNPIEGMAEGGNGFETPFTVGSHSVIRGYFPARGCGRGSRGLTARKDTKEGKSGESFGGHIGKERRATAAITLAKSEKKGGCSMWKRKRKKVRNWKRKENAQRGPPATETGRKSIFPGVYGGGGEMGEGIRKGLQKEKTARGLRGKESDRGEHWIA